MYNLAIVHLFAFRRTCSQHHLELILIGNIQHFHDFPVRHSFISIKRHIHFRFFRSARLQERSQFFQRNRLLLIISKRRIKIQILIYNHSRQGLSRRLLFSLRKQHLDSIRLNNRRRDHKEDQQQEDDVRHGCHTEIGRYFSSPL